MVATNYRLRLDFPVLGGAEREQAIREIQLGVVGRAKRELVRPLRAQLPVRSSGRGIRFVRLASGKRVFARGRSGLQGEIVEEKPGALRRSFRAIRPRARNIRGFTSRTGRGYFVAGRFDFLYYLHFLRAVWPTFRVRSQEALADVVGDVTEDVLRRHI